MKINHPWAYNVEQWENIIRIVKIWSACNFSETSLCKHELKRADWLPKWGGGNQSKIPNMCIRRWLLDLKKICCVLQSIPHQLFPPWRFQRTFIKCTDCQDPVECIDKTINNMTYWVSAASIFSAHVFPLIHVVTWQAFCLHFIDEDTLQHVYTACPRPHGHCGQVRRRLGLPWT